MTKSKICQRCFKKFEKKPKEGYYHWSTRKFCSAQCYLITEKKKTWDYAHS